MDLGNSLPFYPRQLLARGAALLSGGILLAGGLLFSLTSGPYLARAEENRKEKPRDSNPLVIDLGLGTSTPYFPFPSLDREFSVSFEPPRPDGALGTPSLLVRLHKTTQLKRFVLPCRIDLCYDREGRVSFTESGSPFWVDLSPKTSGEIEVKVFMQGLSEHPFIFSIQPQLNPLLSLQELPIGSPFRNLAEGKWWGRDLFCEKYGGALDERIEVGPPASSEILDIKESDWLTYQAGKWKKIFSLEEGKGLPVARIRSIEGRQLILEGWDQANHYSFALDQPSPIPFKVRPEELLTSVRVRSDRQISCMLEKQCLILKTGDWVFKGDGRWRVLRKKEDREALQKGKLIGEIFVFDRIDADQGQKMIRGHLFNLSRSQSVPVELLTQSMRTGGKNQERKSRVRPR